ncbi:replication-associated recombination protein A [Patescibacteria group bacterium]
MTASHIPLAEKIRPQTLEELVGQEHLVGPKGLLRKLIKSDQIPSMIFWGPPGSGKTSLARVIAQTTQSNFLHHSAVTTTLKDVREAVKQANNRLSGQDQLSFEKKVRSNKNQALAQRTIFFLDEIHRFNKAQQDAFLPHVESGTITLIGATTENPSFEVIGPLLSRSRVFTLNRLSTDDLKTIINKGLKKLKAKISPQARKLLIEAANGDARIALNALQIASSINQKGEKISIQLIEDVFQNQNLLYDRTGEEHYNTISSFIKSMRASNADAAIYYLTRMIEAGEDPLFIARRMVIFASEDIGMAQPTALVVANEVFRACETIGYPECAINLAHGTIYLAKAPKNRASYDALRAAQADVKQFGNLPIPMHLRNAPTKLMKKEGYGKNYEKYPGKKKNLLPEKLKGKKYYKD